MTAMEGPPPMYHAVAVRDFYFEPATPRPQPSKFSALRSILSNDSRADSQQSKRAERREAKEERKEARSERKEARAEARLERKEIRGEARLDRKESRLEERLDRKEARLGSPSTFRSLLSRKSQTM